MSRVILRPSAHFVADPVYPFVSWRLCAEQTGYVVMYELAEGAPFAPGFKAVVRGTWQLTREDRQTVQQHAKSIALGYPEGVFHEKKLPNRLHQERDGPISRPVPARRRRHGVHLRSEGRF
jgi:hypothetical protein